MEFLSKQFYGNTVEQYLYSLALIVATIIVAKIGQWLVMKKLCKLASLTKTRLDDMIFEQVLPPVVYLFMIGGLIAAKSNLKVPEPLDLWVDKALVVASLVVVFFVITRFVKVVVNFAIDMHIERARASGQEDAELKARFAERLRRQAHEISAMVIWVLAVLTILSNLGVDLKAIWASLGIGGIALVVAVKEPLSNLVGRLYIFSTGLFDEGHFILFDKWGGTVTRIGLFRTNMELFSDMTTVSIPNADFVKGVVKTYFGRTRFIYKWDLDVPYNTKPEKLGALTEKVRELIKAKEELNPDRCWIYLDRLGSHSKVLRVWFQVNLPDWATSLFYGENVLHEIQHVFADEGVSFAFPTQTLHLEAQQLLGAGVPEKEAQ